VESSGSPHPVLEESLMIPEKSIRTFEGVFEDSSRIPQGVHGVFEDSTRICGGVKYTEKL
jgi:hypothetical protein